MIEHGTSALLLRLAVSFGFAPKSGPLVVMFEVQALANAHLGLFTAALDTATMYEFVIGGEDNTRSVLRRSHGGPALAERVGTALAQGSRTKMWLVYNRTGTLSVGTGEVVGENEWMYWTDPDPLVITEVLRFLALGPSNFVPCPLVAMRLHLWAPPATTYGVLTIGHNLWPGMN